MDISMKKVNFFAAALLSVTIFFQPLVLAAPFGKSNSYGKPSSSTFKPYSSPSSSFKSSSTTNKKPSSSLGYTRPNVNSEIKSGTYNYSNSGVRDATPKVNSNSSPSTFSSTSKPSSTSSTSSSSIPSSNNTVGSQNNYSNTTSNNRNNTNTYVNNARSNTNSNIGSFVLGGLAGYLLFSDNKGNNYFVNPKEPNIAYNEKGEKLDSIPQGDYVESGLVPDKVEKVTSNNVVSNPVANPVKANADKSNNFIMLFLVALFLLLLLVLAVMSSRKRTGNSNSSQNLSPLKPNMGFNSGFTSLDDARVSGELEKIYRQLFIDFQMKNKPSLISWYKDKVTSDFYMDIEELVMGQSEDREIKVQNYSAKIADITRHSSFYEASVHYQGELIESSKKTQNIYKLNQQWNFLYENGKWLLAGIEDL